LKYQQAQKNMKTLQLLTILLFNCTLSFSQLSFDGAEGLKDTSNFSALRGKIKSQTMFIKFDTTDVSAYFARAASYYQLGNYETCISEQNDILRRFPDYAADVYTNRGMCYSFLKNYTLALSDLHKAKLLSPTDAKVFLNLAFAYTAKKEYTLAIVHLDTAINLRPDYAKAFANRGYAKKELKNYVEAINDFNKALEIQPNYAEVYFNRGYAHFKLNKFDAAIADFNAALQSLPMLSTSYDFYMYRGIAYEKKGDLVNSKMDYDKAAKLKLH
jgi:tetratricopeptide (TPR) repeat protein